MLTDTTADLGFTLLVSAARRVPELDAFVKAGHWRKGIGEEHFGTDIHGRTLGSSAPVASARPSPSVATSASTCRSSIYRQQRQAELEEQMGAQRRELDELLKEADFVCLVVPLSTATEASSAPANWG